MPGDNARSAHHDSVDLPRAKPRLTDNGNLGGSRDGNVSKSPAQQPDDGLSHGRDRAPGTTPNAPRC